MLGEVNLYGRIYLAYGLSSEYFYPHLFWIYRYIPTIYDELPEWCKEAVAGLLEQKKREYRESGTLKSYRCSCVGFCLFLIDHGYDSFKRISPEIIKEFSIQDEHSTFKGRATRFVMVRAFLRYLDEHRYTKRHGLDQCLISGSASVDKIIDVLSDEQVHRIRGYRLTHNSPAELRDIAIVLLRILNSFYRKSGLLDSLTKLRNGN